MSGLALLADPAFWPPFLTGLCFALLLPLVGAYLRLADEWAAALAFAQTAAAGALVAMLAGWPLALGGVGAALAAASGRALFVARTGPARGAAYALLLLAGWGVSVLLTSNFPLAERAGHALFDGQLYFTGEAHLLAALLALGAGLAGLRRLSRPLLRRHFLPAFAADGATARAAPLAFDLLTAAALALATASIGVMAALALVFVPPLIAARAARDWRHGLWLAGAIGAGAHGLAFLLALAVDQPYGPLLALCLAVPGAWAVLARSSGKPGRLSEIAPPGGMC